MLGDRWGPYSLRSSVLLPGQLRGSDASETRGFWSMQVCQPQASGSILWARHAVSREKGSVGLKILEWALCMEGAGKRGHR